MTLAALCHASRRAAQDVLAGSNNIAEEVLTLSRTVRTFGTEGTEQKRYTSWLE